MKSVSRSGLFLIGLFLLTNCSRPGIPVSAKKDFNYDDFLLLAWNEDTVHSCLFALAENRRFNYYVPKGQDPAVQTRYKGKIAINSSADTLFLEYSKNKIPPGFRNYLVSEASGMYWIQFCDNNSRRIFLRPVRGSGH